MKVLDNRGTASKIKSSMAVNGVTCKQAAKMIGVSIVAVSRWRSGESLPTIDNLVMLSDLCHCQLDDLVATQEV